MPLLDIQNLLTMPSPRQSTVSYFEASELQLHAGSGPLKSYGIYRSTIDFQTRSHVTEKLLNLDPISNPKSHTFTVLEHLNQLIAPNQDAFALYALDSIQFMKPLLKFDCPIGQCSKPRAHEALHTLVFERNQKLAFFDLSSGESIDSKMPKPEHPESIKHGFQWLGSWGALWMESHADIHNLVLWSPNLTKRIPLQIPSLNRTPVFYAEINEDFLHVWLDTQESIQEVRISILDETIQHLESLLKPTPSHASRISKHGNLFVALLPEDGQPILWKGSPWKAFQRMDCNGYTFARDETRY